MARDPYCPLTNITMPVFGRPDETLETIRALRGNSGRSALLTVVDNGNEPGFRKELEALADRGMIDHLFILDRNYGISPACNVGWQLVDAPFFMKLDNDTKVLSPDWLESIYGLWGRERHSTILGPVWNCAQEMGRRQTPYGALWVLPVSFIGTAFLIGKKISGRIGYFNEDYGLYGEEDADYCLRCHHAGIRKYSFEAQALMTRIDRRKPDPAYDAFKLQEHQRNVGERPGAGMFALNVFLYEHKLRDLRVPLQYAVKSVRGRHVELVENPACLPFRESLSRCLDLFNACGRAPRPDTLNAMRRILCKYTGTCGA